MCVHMYVCIYIHVFTQTGTKLNHCFFSKGLLYSKNKKLTSVQLELILQLREYTSDSHILPEKKSSLKSNITGYIK